VLEAISAPPPAIHSVSEAISTPSPAIPSVSEAISKPPSAIPSVQEAISIMKAIPPHKKNPRHTVAGIFYAHNPHIRHTTSEKLKLKKKKSIFVGINKLIEFKTDTLQNR
jgi:hypothetical protein